MRVDLLEETLDRLEREGRRPKFIYTVPNFQNPAGVTMSLPRRKRLVEVAHERELLVLEDNPYGLLRYEGEPLPPLYALDGGVYVMYLGTFSKILSPGHPARLGRRAAARCWRRSTSASRRADLCTSTLSQLIVQAYFEQAAGATTSTSLTEIYRARRDTMLDALAEHFPPEAEWTRPGGGLFIWATLPDFIDTTDLLARGAARQRRVRARRGGVPRRPRPQLDAAELLRLRRGRDPRGHPPHRRGREASRSRSTARSPASRPAGAGGERRRRRRRAERRRAGACSCRAAPTGERRAGA